MIKIEQASRSYGALVAVHPLTATIGPGEVVGLLGHNGAGKTTLMKLLTGYLEPSSGAVHIQGHDSVTAREQLQRCVGYLPESAPLYPEMLVQEYLWMMADLRSIPRAAQREAVIRAVRRTGLTQHLLQSIGTLSKGFRQRVGLAQAILHSPKVLVLDEPTNGLDPAQILSIRSLIRELSEESTIILSTHIMQEVEAVCDRVLFMIRGRLVKDTPLLTLLQSHQVQLQALGSEVEAALTALPSVQSVTRSAPNTYQIHCEDPVTAARAVFTLASERRWQVSSLGPVHPSLDAVFRELLQQEATP